MSHHAITLAVSTSWWGHFMRKIWWTKIPSAAKGSLVYFLIILPMIMMLTLVLSSFFPESLQGFRSDTDRASEMENLVMHFFSFIVKAIINYLFLLHVNCFNVFRKMLHTSLIMSQKVLRPKDTKALIRNKVDFMIWKINFTHFRQLFSLKFYCCNIKSWFFKLLMKAPACECRSVVHPASTSGYLGIRDSCNDECE